MSPASGLGGDWGLSAYNAAQGAVTNFTRALALEYGSRVPVGIPVATRTTPPPRLDGKRQAEFMKKAQELAPKYRTELLKEA